MDSFLFSAKILSIVTLNPQLYSRRQAWTLAGSLLRNLVTQVNSQADILFGIYVDDLVH